MLIGYARCSAQHQKLDRQIDALTAVGCEKIFQEKASGKDTTGRPQLAKALDYLKQDDILVVAEWDRATRSMVDGLKIIQQVAERKAYIKVLDKKDFDLTTPIGRGVIALLSAIAESERNRIVARAELGRASAIRKGVKFGPKFKLNETQRNHAHAMLCEGKTKTEVAKLLGVHVSTISRLT